jgi:hypothetical protein
MEETVSKGQDDSLPAEGGDSACWAHLVCPGCGAITSEAHREGCELARNLSKPVLVETNWIRKTGRAIRRSGPDASE